MAVRPNNSYTRLADVPVHYDRRSRLDYGTRGVPTRFYGTSESERKLDNCFFELWDLCPYGKAEVITSAGAWVNKRRYHGEGRAFDLDGIFWSNRTFVTFWDGYQGGDRKFYFGVEAVIRKHFGTVLNYLYNAPHRDHFHLDDGTSVGFQAGLQSKVKFLQGALVYVLGISVGSSGIDGDYGRNTKAAVRQAFSQLGISGSITNVSVWKQFLTKLATTAFGSIPVVPRNIAVLSPTPGQSFSPQQSIPFEITSDSDIETIKIVSDNAEIATKPKHDRNLTVNANLLESFGQKSLKVRGFDAENRLIAETLVDVVLNRFSSQDYNPSDGAIQHLGNITSALNAGNQILSPFVDSKIMIQLKGGQLYFDGEMALTVDGSPRAPEIDPCCGLVTTLLQYPNRTGQQQYINSEEIPYIALPEGYEEFGIKLGDIAAIIYNGKLEFAVFANISRCSYKLSSGSIALIRSLLGINDFVGDISTVGIPEDVSYLIFPGSGDGTPQSPEEIRRKGKLLFKQLGGQLPEDIAAIHQQSSFVSHPNTTNLTVQNLLTTPQNQINNRMISSFVLRDGRYEGGNRELFVKLRLDETTSGVISADIYRVGFGARTYAVSIRTTPRVKISLTDGSWEIIGSDSEDRTSTGKLTLESQNIESSSITGFLALDSAVGGLPVGVAIYFAADWIDNTLRQVGLELEREDNVNPLPTYDDDGQLVTVESAFKKAGIEITTAGLPSLIPNNLTPTNGWGTSQLHALMEDFAEASLLRATWELHLLLLSRSSRSGLLGVMFDSTPSLPRQGTAVFSDEIERFSSPDEFPRKLIQTTMHELGHALNLAHRFEREVGRADSTSIMNYDWRYKGGNRRQEFWSKFDFTFDSDELEFLCHAPRPLVIPGGAAFHSINYWADGNGGYSPYVPELPFSIFSLTLRPPINGAIFDFAQPVFLEVELKNESNQAYNLQPELLDPKTGFLEILIRRLGQNEEAEHFHPIVERCFDLEPNTLAVVNPGQSIRNNINLTFGSAGFPFAEPGEYEVTALFVIPIQQAGQNVELVVRSNTLRIRVRYPSSREQENDAMILFEEEVGLYFALGGLRSLSKTSDQLEEIKQKRQGKSTRITDPIVANIVRCQGIDAGRIYTRYQKGKFIQEKGDRAKAAELLGQLTPKSLEVFDAQTAESTSQLAKKHQQSVK